MKPEHTALQDAWTYDEFMRYAELAQKDDMTFALGLGGFTNTDAIDQVGALFRAYGAALIDKEGEIQVKSDEMRQVLEYSQKLVKFLPASAASFDDASNNRALISGKSALIFNPPSAWAVAKRDAPQVAADCWTFSAPVGPKGRFVPTLTFFWGVWKFSPNQSAAKELIEYLLQREQAEARSNAVDGYDIPPYANMLDFKIWETVEPPPGPSTTTRSGPGTRRSRASPRPRRRPTSPCRSTIARSTPGCWRDYKADNRSQTIAWAQGELEGFAR